MGTKYADDPSIPHDERLFRRINITHVVERDADKTEVSSAAFRDDELSVNLESVMKSACRPPEDALRNSPNDRLMSVAAGVCRDHEQKVGPDPTPEEPAHGYVFGKKSKAIRRALRDAAKWVVPQEPPRYSQIREMKKQPGIGGRDAGTLGLD
jgi:hypothetical protein